MAGFLRRGITLVSRSSLFAAFVGLLEQFGDRRANLLRVLMYHRVDHPEHRPDLFPGLISATPDEFHNQMEFVAANYHVATLEEVRDAILKKTELPPRSVLLTFDDAYCDFAENAWPVLKRFNLPVVLFVPTAFPASRERSFWWDRLYQAIMESPNRDHIETPIGPLSLKGSPDRWQTFRRLSAYIKTIQHQELEPLLNTLLKSLDFSLRPKNHVLSWDELRRLAAEGVTLSPHSQTHPLLNRVSLDVAKNEVVGSLHDLEREIGPTLPAFAYPAGGFTDEVAQMLRDEGFVMAFTSERGITNIARDDPHLIHRIHVGPHTTQALMRAQLLGWLSHVHRWI